MNSGIPRHIIRFIGLMLLQVLVLNEIELHGFINPYIYPLFILLLPFEIPHALLLVLAFGLGITMDLFSHSLGLHAAACVFMAFLRPLIINLNRPRGGYESTDKPSVKMMGFRWFLIYASIALLLHHLFFFFVEVFSFANFEYTLMKVAISTLISTILVMIYEYLFYNVD